MKLNQLLQRILVNPVLLVERRDQGTMLPSNTIIPRPKQGRDVTVLADDWQDIAEGGMIFV